jgi:aminoglycoside phosphotransferase
MVTDDIHRWLERTLGSAVEVQAVAGRDGHHVHRIQAADGRLAFLKAAPDTEGERARLEWLDGRVPAPRVLGFRKAVGSQDLLLTSAVAGRDLTTLVDHPDRVVALLAAGLRQLHSLDASGCPFGERGPGAVLVHGDACLPNLLTDGARITGYVDLAECGLGSPQDDLAAAVWSLDFNLGPGHGLRFLHAYGVTDADEPMVDRLRAAYDGD